MILANSSSGYVFTTILASSSYKYASELKGHAQNMMLFAPLSINNDFSSYNTFLSKLCKFAASLGVIFLKYLFLLSQIIGVLTMATKEG